MSRIQDIVSCYIGDLGVKQRKQAALPTLIIHLRPDNQQVSSPRSFRRRSHENPYAARSAPTVLFFRSATDDPVSLQQWAKDIQFYLNACVAPQNDTSPLTPTQHSFSEVPETSSIFFVNGEPNTALLSPSLRSKCSDLSSIPSDRRSVSSSSVSELPSPRMEDHIHEHHGRTGLHIATNSEEFDLQQFDSRGQQVAAGPSDYKRSYRRETILDRYFSSYSIPVPVDTPTSSSISRFEALMTEMESKQGGRKNSLTSLRELSIPQTIPSPTLRALEFVSTGIYHPGDIPESRSNSLRQSFAYPEGYHPQRSGVSSTFSQSRRSSESSTGDHSAETSSITGVPTSTLASSSPCQSQLSCASPRGKRHSIGDFSMRNATSGSGYVVGSGGTGITMISEMTHELNDEPILAQLTTAHSFGRRNENPLQSAYAGYF